MILTLKIIAIIVFSPLVGGILTGIDRIITARMQGRKGPPLLQPFYDVLKLFQKESIEVNNKHRFYIYISFIFIIITTVIFLTGGDILIIVFIFTLGSIFFVLGGYASNSPYSFIGAERELLLMMAYEPMVVLVGVGLYYVNKSFFIKDIISGDFPAIILLPGVFFGMLYVLTFKLRKSPFDLSMSHHGHQEIVKGITTEYSGKDLAIIEITHWYETIIGLAFIFVFFAYSSKISYLYGILACVFAYFLEIIIDNAFARYKWELVLKSTWIVTGVLGGLNILILSLLKL